MIKDLIRKILFALRIDLTKNQIYDRLTLAIMDKVLEPDSNCLDIGCHKGEVMDIILARSPQGRHTGFEPIPYYFNHLKSKYSSRPNVQIRKEALSNEKGEAEFNWVKNAPAYSGLKQRAYAVERPDIEKIKVKLDSLNNLLNSLPKIRLIKIDVEGAELGVLKGADQLLQRDRPVVVFEFGLGASDFYGTTARQIFDYFNDLGYGVFTLKGFVKGSNPLTAGELERIYQSNEEYYFATKYLNQ